MGVPTPNLILGPDGLPLVRFYVKEDPVYADVDNRPLSDLAERDRLLAQIIANLNSTIQSLIPVGSVFSYIANTPPLGFLLLNGETIGKEGSTAIYKGEYLRNLFDLVKLVTPNTGLENFDNLDLVVLPNATQKFLLGKANSGIGSNLGESGGQINHTHLFSIPNHSHSVNSHTHSIVDHSHELPFASAGYGSVFALNSPIFGRGTNRTHFSIHAAIDSGTPENRQCDLTSTVHMDTGAAAPTTNSAGASSLNSNSQNPPYLAVRFIIKY
jgi:hypothetical protein